MSQKKWLRKLVLNEHLDVVLDENGKTWVLLDGEVFIMCKRLVLNINLGEAPKYDNITSIDEAAEQHATLYMGHGFEKAVKDVSITPEEEYLGHCSNLQAWVDHGYDTRILHANIAFNLLRGLAEVGDEKAERVLNAELAERARAANRTTAIGILAAYLDQKPRPVVMEALLANKDPEVRRVVSTLPNLPPEYMARLAVDEDLATRHKIAARSDITDDIAARMVNDEDEGIRSIMARRAGLSGTVDISYGGNVVATVPGTCELLNLSGNGIEHIPDIVGLDKLLNLKGLILSENKIERIEGLDKLVKLEQLSLGHNRITRIEGMDSLTEMRHLAITNNQITRIEGLDKLVKMLDLRLYDNQITSLRGLETLVLLRQLIIYSNKIERIECLDKLEYLSLLDLSENQVRKMEGLGSLKHLYHLNLAGNQIERIEGLDGLQYLGMLNLCDNRLASLDLERLSRFKYLKSVGFSGNPAPFAQKGWVAWPLKESSAAIIRDKIDIAQ